jgi:hypothetical protein
MVVVGRLRLEGEKNQKVMEEESGGGGGGEEEELEEGMHERAREGER